MKEKCYKRERKKERKKERKGKNFDFKWKIQRELAANTSPNFLGWHHTELPTSPPRWRLQGPLNHCYPTATLGNVTTQKTSLLL